MWIVDGWSSGEQLDPAMLVLMSGFVLYLQSEPREVFVFMSVLEWKGGQGYLCLSLKFKSTQPNAQ